MCLLKKKGAHPQGTRPIGLEKERLQKKAVAARGRLMLCNGCIRTETVCRPVKTYLNALQSQAAQVRLPESRQPLKIRADRTATAERVRPKSEIETFHCSQKMWISLSVNIKVPIVKEQIEVLKNSAT